jgi:hypothetical protein
VPLLSSEQNGGVRVKVSFRTAEWEVVWLRAEFWSQKGLCLFTPGLCFLSIWK